MIPSREEALFELKLAEELNPGPWTHHSLFVAEAAEKIAAAAGLDSETAYVFGLLHDIGRRAGVSQMRHIIDGYDYLMSRGWQEAAKICLTHSFPVKNIEADIGKKDITDTQYGFIKSFLESAAYDDYDRLIILCDALASGSGFCILEKRFVDTTRRYGVFPFTLERWNETLSIKEYFDKICGTQVYRLLPGIECCIYS